MTLLPAQTQMTYTVSYSGSNNLIIRCRCTVFAVKGLNYVCRTANAYVCTLFIAEGLNHVSRTAVPNVYTLFIAKGLNYVSRTASALVIFFGENPPRRHRILVAFRNHKWPARYSRRVTIGAN